MVDRLELHHDRGLRDFGVGLPDRWPGAGNAVLDAVRPVRGGEIAPWSDPATRVAPV